MATPKFYRRLKGRSFGFLNASSLWEGEDHLLLVESHRVSETYRRFFYRDIQAILVCETKTGRIVSVVSCLLALIFGGSAFTVPFEAALVLGLFSGVFSLVALISFLRGPSCRCTLRTAVQTQHLPSLSRLRIARRTLLRIHARIAAAQEIPLPR